MDLIIVESPSKAKTISKYLEGKYKVDASGGHIRDLPEKRLGVNIDKNFEPTYVVSKDKKEVITRLLEQAKKADKVYLATDPDREGEAISWHLKTALKLKDENTARIEFNEISPTAIKEALKNPREIDINLVDAQQARRVLDRLVGYKISPIVSKRLQSSLSAGRVQSVALRLVCDREREIMAFIPEEFWNIKAELKCKEEKPTFKALLVEKGGKKYKPTNEQEANEVIESLKSHDFIVSKVKRAETKSSSPAPFTTSTLQQDASSKLNLTAPEVMQVAQHLYEGIDTSTEGHIAFVTYIRTDSVRISKEAQEKALNFIKGKYGEEYAPATPNIYKTKKNAQDAHEAIRPIDLQMTPEKASKLLDKKHYSVYKLIYERFLASQMVDAIYNSVQINIENGIYGLKASGKTLKFAGFTIVYQENKQSNDDEEDNKLLPNVNDGDRLDLIELFPEQKFTKPPQRYTDASLVKTMEEKGIGRPSTYASIIQVLTKRKYVKKDGKYMVPTEMGFSLTDMMVKYFTDIMDISFTAKMENQLDEIEDGGKDWHKIIADFYPSFSEQLYKCTTDGDEMTDILCEKCGHPMIRRSGRYSKYLACSNYPECSNIKSEGEEISETRCPKCGSNMVVKSGKYGRFLACPNYPECSQILPIEAEVSDELCEKCGTPLIVKKGKFGKYLNCPKCNINKSIAEKVGICPECGKDTQKMSTKRGKTFYGCTGYPDCKFMSWDIPTGEKCSKCNEGYLVKKGKIIKCSNADCDYQVDNKEK